MRAVSQRLSDSSSPACEAGVRRVAKTFSRAMNSRKSAYHVRSWWACLRRTLPRSSNQAIVASRTRRVSSSKPAASYVRGLNRVVDAATVAGGWVSGMGPA